LMERLALIERVDLQPGSLTVRLDKAMLADRLGCAPEQVNPVELTTEAPFQMRRRGVELKLHLGEAPAEIDRTLVQNIMKGRNWLAMVVAGKSFSEIADTEGVSKRRVQDLTNLALLAPDVLDRIAAGEQPDGLTSDYLIKTRFSAVWSEQREQFAAL
ncbi:MAG: recombinase family protein, partial [Albidovulum sp.]